MADGHLNKCISCTKNDVHNNYAINKLNLTYRLQERKRNRNKWHRLYSKKVIKQNSIVKVRWNHKNSYKRNTQNQLRRAIKKGLIIRPTNCISCGKFCKPEAHHEDYSKPFDVIWLCFICHGLTRHKLD